MTEEEYRDSIFLRKFLEERNYTLESAETRYVIDLIEHPQLNHILFHPDISVYEMWDSDGNYFTFKALDYSQEKETEIASLVKKLYKRNIT